MQLASSALVCFYSSNFRLTFALLLVALIFSLDPSAVDLTVVKTCKCSDEFLLSVLSDTLNVRFKFIVCSLIRALALYCRDSGQVPLSVCLFNDLMADSAWKILLSADCGDVCLPCLQLLL